jgi:hypothetical protein
MTGCGLRGSSSDGMAGPQVTMEHSPMNAANLIYFVSTVAILAVAVVLVWGLSTLLRGGTPNLSQNLMRWRIGLQFIAIFVIMLFVYVTRGFA